MLNVKHPSGVYKIAACKIDPNRLKRDHPTKTARSNLQKAVQVIQTSTFECRWHLPEKDANFGLRVGFRV